MGIKAGARSLLTRIGRGFAASRVATVYRPDLSDAAFFARLTAMSDELRAGKGSVLAGDAAAARLHVVRHFVRRSTPRFFVDIDAVDALARRVREEHPAWSAAVLDRAKADLDNGLAIVSGRGAPLAHGFDWTAIAPGPGGDDLYSAQPHRYGFLPGLVLAAHHGLPTLAVVRTILDRWTSTAVAGNPDAYLSALVVLYRVIALSFALPFMGGLPGESDAASVDAQFAILKVVGADIAFLARTLGDSVPNNHLLADGFAGWYCGTIFPEFTDAADIRAKGEALFVHELCRQFYADGTSFEHSTHYHELGCEMAVAYVLLSRRNGLEPDAEVVERTRRMIAFQSVLSGAEAVPFPIGDSTEDPLFPLDAGHGWAPGAMRELYRALFDGTIPAAPACDVTVERAFWLLAGALAPRAAAAGAFDALPRTFPRGGLYVLEDRACGARLLLRSGPAEDTEIFAGHAHADLLSVYLSVGGVPLIVDAGTYTYRLKSPAWPAESPDWRAYFAGPRSHNGPRTDGDPYGTLIGDFRTRDVPCRVRSRRSACGPGLSWLEFEIIGDNALRGHRRGVVHVEGRYWIVYDIAADERMARNTSIALQFAQGADVAPAGERGVAAVKDRAACFVALGSSLSRPTLLEGSMRPVAGWVSPHYGKLAAAPQLAASILPDRRQAAFVLRASDQPAAAIRIDAEIDGETWLGLRVIDGDFVDVLLVRTEKHGDAMVGWDVEEEGELTWVRRGATGVIERRAVDPGREVTSSTADVTRSAASERRTGRAFDPKA